MATIADDESYLYVSRRRQYAFNLCNPVGRPTNRAECRACETTQHALTIMGRSSGLLYSRKQPLIFRQPEWPMWVDFAPWGAVSKQLCVRLRSWSACYWMELASYERSWRAISSSVCGMLS